MKVNHNEYLNYELPDDWCAEESGDNLLLYHPDGNGAMTISFFSVLDTEESLDEKVSILAKSFIDRNDIELHAPFTLFQKDNKTILYGLGTTFDGWFVKLWIVAKQPKIVLATYQSERENTEVKTCDFIIDSFQLDT